MPVVSCATCMCTLHTASVSPRFSARGASRATMSTPHCVWNRRESMTANSVTGAGIASTHELIRPHVRRTPVLEARGADFGLNDSPLWLKLEFTQHAGSFKTRGAFANLLTHKVPTAGVAAASGGNHGAAVAYAAMRLGHKARIFVPTISSPAKIAHIRGYGAELAVGGATYDEALGACEEWIAGHGSAGDPCLRPNGNHARPRQRRARTRGASAGSRYGTGCCRRRRIDRRHGCLVRRPHQDPGR